MENKVFLGGTCNGSPWRDAFVDSLQVDWFNPVVDDWNDEAYQRELHERENDAVVLYGITPMAEGFYSVAEVVDDSNKRPERTVLLIKETDGDKTFSAHHMKSLKTVAKMVEANGGAVFWEDGACADFINKKLSGAALKVAG